MDHKNSRSDLLHRNVWIKLNFELIFYTWKKLRIIQNLNTLKKQRKKEIIVKIKIRSCRWFYILPLNTWYRSHVLLSTMVSF